MESIPVFDPNDLKASGFLAARPDIVRETIERYHQEGPGKLAWLTDWDGANIPERPSTWDRIRETLPQHLKEKHEQLKLENLPKLDNGEMSSKQSYLFTGGALDLLEGCDFAPIRHAMAGIVMLDGARHIFNICEKQNVPTVVKSAGISNCIEITATSNGVKPSLIIATRLIIENGVIKGWEKESMTHDLDKLGVEHKDLAPLLSGRTNKIITGDRPSDTTIAGDSAGLFVRVGGKVTDKLLEESFSPLNPEHRAYDLVALDEGMLSTAGLFNYLLR